MLYYDSVDRLMFESGVMPHNATPCPPRRVEDGAPERDGEEKTTRDNYEGAG